MVGKHVAPIEQTNLIPESREISINISPHSPPLKSISYYLALCTGVRLCFLLEFVPVGIRQFLKSAPLKFGMVNPLYTFGHLREGNFLIQLFGGSFESAYKGNGFRSPPLLLAAFQPLLSVEPQATQNLLIGIFVIIIDLAIVLCLHDISCRSLFMSKTGNIPEMEIEVDMHERIRPKRAWIFGIEFQSCYMTSGSERHDFSEDRAHKSVKEPDCNTSDSYTEDRMTALDHLPRNMFSTSPSPRPVLDLILVPYFCSLFYYANPVSIVSAIGSNDQSFQNILHLLILLALREVMGPIEKPSTSLGQSISLSTSAFYLALASYIEIYPFVYLVPVILFAGKALGNTMQAAKTCVGYFLLWSFVLHVITFILVGSEWMTILSKTWGRTYSFSGISPNLGMHWYFFIQIFDRFRLYFVVLLNGLPYIFVMPLSVRLSKYPLELATSLFALGAIFKPVLTCQDLMFVVALFLLSPRTLTRMGNASLVSAFALVVPVTLVIMDYWLWLETGSGNANYMYFQCLAFCTFFGIMTLDFVSATLKRDKALRLTEKTSKRNKNEDKPDKCSIK